VLTFGAMFREAIDKALDKACVYLRYCALIAVECWQNNQPEIRNAKTEESNKVKNLNSNNH
jgi:hypothetical protein